MQSPDTSYSNEPLMSSCTINPESGFGNESLIMPISASTVAGDILYGAESIGRFLFGEHVMRRRIYHLVEHGGLPTFRMGVAICARKSILIEWIRQQELAASPASSGNPLQPTQPQQPG
jgi:hypothetical protein